MIRARTDTLQAAIKRSQALLHRLLLIRGDADVDWLLSIERQTLAKLHDLHRRRVA